jgi:hypothetical protein
MMFSEKQLRTSQGKLRTKSLFWELSYFEPEHVIFTLREEDLVKNDKTYVSLRKLYLSYCCSDPTDTPSHGPSLVRGKLGSNSAVVTTSRKTLRRGVGK